MRYQAAEQGNAILIATVLVLGMTVTSLALVKFMQRYADDSAGRKNSGFAATQAQFMAEAGINSLMIELNVRGKDPGTLLTCDATHSTTVDYEAYSVPLSMEFHGVQTGATPSAVPPEYEYTFTGQARADSSFPSKWSQVKRVAKVRIAGNAVGNPWRITRYEQP